MLQPARHYYAHPLAIGRPPRQSHRRERHYPSQLDLRPYGNLICTPVSLLVAAAYIRGPHEDPFEALGPALVRDMMATSHSLYEHCFTEANEERPLMVQDLTHFLPRDELHVLEAVGMLLEAPEDGPGPVEAHHVASLEALLGSMDRSRDVGRGALVVTTGDHTTAYLFDTGRGTYHFDPLGACLRDVSGDLCAADLRRRAGGTPRQEYAGLALFPRAPAGGALL